MADSRGYFKVTNNFPDHPKVVEVGGDAGWLHVCAMAYCSGNFTDGMVPIKLVPRLSDREYPKQLASNLLGVGLWHASGHECKKCPQPDDKHYVIHDYLDHQTSAERARETSVKRADAGRRGGEAKAAASKLPGSGYSGASSKSLAEQEQEQEEEQEKKTTSSSARGKRGKKDRPIAPRFDEFWAAYPRRDDRAPAEMAWTETVEDIGIDPQVLIDAAKRYAKERKGQPRNFTKLGATWFHKRSWENEPTPLFDAAANGHRSFDDADADFSPDFFDEDPR